MAEAGSVRRFLARDATRKWLREFAGVVLGVLVALRAAVRDARLQNRFITLLGVRMRQVADVFALRYERTTLARHRGSPGQLAICRPVPDKVPSAYGEAPLAGGVERAERDPIRR